MTKETSSSKSRLVKAGVNQGFFWSMKDTVGRCITDWPQGSTEGSSFRLPAFPVPIQLASSGLTRGSSLLVEPWESLLKNLMNLLSNL